MAQEVVPKGAIREGKWGSGLVQDKVRGRRALLRRFSRSAIQRFSVFSLDSLLVRGQLSGSTSVNSLTSEPSLHVIILSSPAEVLNHFDSSANRFHTASRG